MWSVRSVWSMHVVSVVIVVGVDGQVCVECVLRKVNVLGVEYCSQCSWCQCSQ